MSEPASNASQSIAEAIARLMKEEGLNNISFAELLGVTCATTCRYIKGSRIPPLTRLLQIAKVCNRRLTLTLVDDKITAKFNLKESIRADTFNDKVLECEPALRRYCINRWHLQKHDLDDLVQETIYRALKLHNTFKPEVCSVLTWIIGIAKRSRVSRNSNLFYVENYIENDIIADNEEQFFRSNPKVFQYIEKLKGKKKEFYKLKLAGLSCLEIAERYDTTADYVKTALHTTKKILRRRLENNN